MNLAELIRESTSSSSDKTFLIDRGLYRRKSMSYKDMFDRANSIAGFFDERKIKKGDKVIIYLPNSSDYCSVLMACALTGVIAVPIDFNNNPEFVEKIYRTVKASGVFCSLIKQPSNVKKYFQEAMEDVYDGFRGHEVRAEVSEDDVFEIIYTSGTTAEPKGVVLTHKNLVSNIRALEKVITLPLQDYTFLSILPLSHLFEQTIGFFTPMNYGSTVVYSVSRKSSSIINAIKEENVSGVVSVPLFLSSVKDKIERTAQENGKLEKLHNALERFENAPLWFRKLAFRKIRKNLGALRLFVVGGSALDLEVERFWRTIGIDVLQGYGLSETSPVLTCNSPEENRKGTVGKPLPGVELRIEEGEVLVRGDNVFKGYYKDKKKSSEVLKKGWFYTGDLGEFDDEGFLKLVGRKKNMILSPSGVNVYPEDIEAVLDKEKGVRDSVVLGLDEGRKIVGVILPEGKPNPEVLKKEVNSKLSPHQYLAEIQVWPAPDFPRTPTLKVKRREVIKGLQKKKEVKHEDVEKLVRMIAEVCEADVRKVKEDTRLQALGLDSIKRIELSVKLEEGYNLEFFNEDEITESTRVKDLRELIKKAEEYRAESGLNFLNSKAFRPLRFALQELIFFMSCFFFSLKRHGVKNVPKKEQVIFICNHVSSFDTFAVMRALPLRPRLNTYSAAATDFLYVGLMRILGTVGRILFNAFSFSRDKNVKQSLKDFGKVVNKGGNVLIFPEGERSYDGKLLPFKQGIGLITWHMEIPVVPIKTKGLHEILPRRSVLPKTGKVDIHFGKPIKFSKMQSYQEITEQLEKEMKKL